MKCFVSHALRALWPHFVRTRVGSFKLQFEWRFRQDRYCETKHARHYQNDRYDKVKMWKNIFFHQNCVYFPAWAKCLVRISCL